MSALPAYGNCNLLDPSRYPINITIFIAQLIYVTFAMTLFIVIIRALLKNYRKSGRGVLSDVFFKLYIFDGSLSILILSLDYIFSRPLIYINPLCSIFRNLFPTPSYILTPYLTIFNHLQFAKVLSMILLATNRFTCIVFHGSHKSHWAKWTYTWMIGTVTLPILFVLQLAVARASIDAYDGEVILGYERVWPFLKTTYFKLGVNIFAFFYVLITSIITYRKMRMMKFNKNRLDQTLTKTTFVICFVFTCNIIMQAILAIVSTETLVKNINIGSATKKIEFFCNDLYLTCSPFVLLLAGSIRKQIFGTTVTQAPIKTVSEKSISTM